MAKGIFGKLKRNFSDFAFATAWARVSLMLSEFYQVEKGTFDVPRAIENLFPSALS